jgi:hypothetical protein
VLARIAGRDRSRRGRARRRLRRPLTAEIDLRSQEA